jgi:alkaline phosphatase D
MTTVWIRRVAGAGLMVALLLVAAAPKAAPKKKPRRPRQYKKASRDQITRIATGNTARAVKYFEGYLAENPGDLESLYGLAMAHGQLEQFDKAMEYVAKAVEAGLPFGRFHAGPRGLLKPLTETKAFRNFAARHAVELIHGPMIGAVTDSRARFWVRTLREVPVQVVASASGKAAGIVKSPVVKTRRGSDFTAVVELSGLAPSTRYIYSVLIDGKAAKIDPQPAFRTFPRRGEKGRFQVGFGGGAGYTPIHEHMWNTVMSHELTAFLALGDNVYIDTPKVPGKVPVWRVFRENWANPAYGGDEKAPGVWFDFSIGDVDFFLLDCRFYRVRPKGAGGRPTMLGPVQKKWLLDRLGKATGTFKVLASSVPWSKGTKGGSKDTWDGFGEEREEIFSFIEANRIEGVFLISADRHRSDAYKTTREKGYPLYEASSSRLTNIHTHGLIKHSLFGYNKKCSFGVLTFDTMKADPELTYQVINIDNKVIHTLPIKRSEISFK